MTHEEDRARARELLEKVANQPLWAADRIRELERQVERQRQRGSARTHLDGAEELFVRWRQRIAGTSPGRQAAWFRRAIISHVLACDEHVDAEGHCKCSRVIEELSASIFGDHRQRVRELEEERDALQAELETVRFWREHFTQETIGQRDVVMMLEGDLRVEHEFRRELQALAQKHGWSEVMNITLCAWFASALAEAEDHETENRAWRTGAVKLSKALARAERGIEEAKLSAISAGTPTIAEVLAAEADWVCEYMKPTNPPYCQWLRGVPRLQVGEDGIVRGQYCPLGSKAEGLCHGMGEKPSVHGKLKEDDSMKSRTTHREETSDD